MKMIKFGMAMVAVLLLISIASAFGVNSPYWDGNEARSLNMHPGQTEVVVFTLQNIAGNPEDATASFKMIEGQEIASVEKSEYDVAAGGMTEVPMTISIPEDAKIGSSYHIRAFVENRPSTSGQTIAMGTGMSIGFTINIGEKPAEVKSTNYTIYWIVGILIALAVVVYIATKKR